MTTVNVVLTPGVDTDQRVSANNQISAAPSGTLADPTIINMPAGRYRMDGPLSIQSKSHIRWTCLAGVGTYPDSPSDSQAFVAYTDKNATQLGLNQVKAFQITNCTNVVGSFLKIDGPNTRRRTENPLYAYWSAGPADHGFAILDSCVDCGFEDCYWYNVNGDGIYLGGSNDRPQGCFYHRMAGMYAGRMNIGLINADNAELIDITGDWSGFAGFDIEPLAADEQVHDAYCEEIHMGSYFFPFTFMGRETHVGGATGLPAGKKNITLKTARTIRCASTGHRALQSGREADGYIVIDGLTDLRNSATIGIALDGPWDSVTVKNCRVRSMPNASPTYAVRADFSPSVTIIDNNFNGTLTDGGFDNLVTGTTDNAPIYIHYGNVWNMGASNDGQPPTVLLATSGQLSLVGSDATLTVAPVDVPGPTFIPAVGFGGAPFRLRSHKGWGRLRGNMGARIRGSQGPSERHPMRLRSANGYGRLRSAQTPSFIRSMEPIANPQTLLLATSAQIALEGGNATLSIRTVSTTAAQLVFAGGTATLAVVGTVHTLQAVSNGPVLTGGEHTLPIRLAATSGTLTLAGSAGLTKRLPETSAAITVAGGTALLRVSLAVTSGTMVLAGTSAGLNGQVGLSATSAQMALAGGTVILSIRAAATSAQVALAGGTATLSLGKTLQATPGEMALLGGIASLHKLIGVGTGTITIEGGTAELGGNQILNLEATAGTVTITGGTAHLTTGSPYPEWPMGELAPEWEMVG